MHSHNASENPPYHLAHNPFVAHWPEQHNVVEVDEPDCPLAAQQLEYLNTYIQDFLIDNMEQRHSSGMHYWLLHYKFVMISFDGHRTHCLHFSIVVSTRICTG